MRCGNQNKMDDTKTHGIRKHIPWRYIVILWISEEEFWQFIQLKNILLQNWVGVWKYCSHVWDSKPELFSDIACLRIPYKPCIVLFGFFFQVSLPRTGVNYACTSMSCQPAPTVLVWKVCHVIAFPTNIVYSIHLIYRYWSILFFLHEEILLFILVVYIFRKFST